LSARGYNYQRYSVERLARDGNGVEQVLAREEYIDVARTLYWLMRGQYPGRVIVLRDRERIIDHGSG
jgi:hypothetical protein